MVVLALLLAAAPAHAGGCERRLSEATVERGIALGTGFLLGSQKAQGNFVYGYDWHQRRVSSGDSAVRQAGATWSLGLLLHAGDASVRPSLERALDFFRRHSSTISSASSDEGTRRVERRFLRYPGDDLGSTGAVALVALAHLEHRRALGSQTPAWSRQALNAYLAQLVASHRKAGGFHRSYRHDDGRPFGPPSPYYDGESLLALAKAARYLGRRDLVPLVIAEAASGYRRHVTEPRARERDPKQTKGYYQWCSLALWELATWPTTADEGDWGERLVELATWMIDEHRVLRRRRNTAYAFEGIVPAYAWARRKGDARADQLACAIDEGLRKLSSWQVGSPQANATIAARAPDARALGGVQNHAVEPLLRVDVTQHQMHALLLARRLYLAGPR